MQASRPIVNYISGELMAIWLVLMLAAYLLGSVPVAYLAARLFRRMDLRQCGTRQVGTGNLWRMTSWRIGLPVGVFDFSKGLVMVWVAQAVGLDIAQQLVVGLAAIIGHNWPIFLRFSGGRGLAPTVGVMLIIPFINDMSPWPTVVFLAILVIGTVILRSSPLPSLIGVAALPLVGWSFHEPLPVILCLLAILLVMVLKRLAVPRTAEASSLGKAQLFFNRLLFDRDIGDRITWMYRSPSDAGDAEQPGQRKG